MLVSEITQIFILSGATGFVCILSHCTRCVSLAFVASFFSVSFIKANFCVQHLSC